MRANVTQDTVEGIVTFVITAQESAVDNMAFVSLLPMVIPANANRDIRGGAVKNVSEDVAAHGCDNMCRLPFPGQRQQNLVSQKQCYARVANELSILFVMDRHARGHVEVDVQILAVVGIEKPTRLH